MRIKEIVHADRGRSVRQRLSLPGSPGHSERAAVICLTRPRATYGGVGLPVGDIHLDRVAHMVK